MNPGDRYVLSHRKVLLTDLTDPGPGLGKVCEGEQHMHPGGTPVRILEMSQRSSRVLIETVNEPKQYAWVNEDDLMPEMEWRLQEASD